MNITKENTDDLNAVLKLHIIKDDYEEKVNNVLKDQRKKASIKGFRPGKVPFGLIKKMYGPGAQIEEINKLVSEGLSNYIIEEKIEILGDPLPRPDENKDIDFESQDEFTFSFDIGLAPEFEIKLSKKNKVPFYEIKIDKKIKEDFLNNYTRKFGEYISGEEVADEDMIKGNIRKISLSAGQEEGDLIEGSTISVGIIKDEKIKKSFIGKKTGDIIDFDIRKAFPNDFELAGILQIDKEKANEINGNYRFDIKEINRFLKASVDQSLFDKVYGEASVKTEEEFMTRLEEEIKENLSKESDYKLNLDTRQMTIEKTEFKLPEEFLKRWLLKTNKDIEVEQVEKDFPHFLEDLRWQLIRNKIARKNEMKVEENELLEEAKSFTKLQFQQYGIFNAEDSQLENFAKEMLKKEEDYRKIADKVLDNKVITNIRELIKIENKKLSADEFNKLFAK